MTTHDLANCAAEIAELSQQHHVLRLDFVEERAGADDAERRGKLGLLVTFDPEAQVTYVGDFFRLQEELSHLLDRPVGLLIDSAPRNGRAPTASDRSPIYAG